MHHYASLSHLQPFSHVPIFMICCCQIFSINSLKDHLVTWINDYIKATNLKKQVKKILANIDLW